jgi:hypothetical protein
MIKNCHFRLMRPSKTEKFWLSLSKQLINYNEMISQDHRALQFWSKKLFGTDWV